MEALANPEPSLKVLPQETLVIHCREDRVIPLDVSLRLAQLIPSAQLHVFGQCGHWTQIERAGRFTRIVSDFLAEQP